MILNAKKQLQSKRKYLCMTPYIWHTVSLLITIPLLSTSLFSHYLPEFPLFPLPAVGKPGVCNKPLPFQSCSIDNQPRIQRIHTINSIPTPKVANQCLGRRRTNTIVIPSCSNEKSVAHLEEGNLRSLYFSICVEFIAYQQSKRPQGLR